MRVVQIFLFCRSRVPWGVTYSSGVVLIEKYTQYLAVNGLACEWEMVHIVWRKLQYIQETLPKPFISSEFSLLVLQSWAICLYVICSKSWLVGWTDLFNRHSRSMIIVAILLNQSRNWHCISGGVNFLTLFFCRQELGRWCLNLLVLFKRSAGVSSLLDRYLRGEVGIFIIDLIVLIDHWEIVMWAYCFQELSC